MSRIVVVMTRAEYGQHVFLWKLLIPAIFIATCLGAAFIATTGDELAKQKKAREVIQGHAIQGHETLIRSQEPHTKQTRHP